MCVRAWECVRVYVRAVCKVLRVCVYRRLLCLCIHGVNIYMFACAFVRACVRACAVPS